LAVIEFRLAFWEVGVLGFYFLSYFIIVFKFADGTDTADILLKLPTMETGA
jgi:hypothetical protein